MASGASPSQLSQDKLKEGLIKRASDVESIIQEIKVLSGEINQKKSDANSKSESLKKLIEESQARTKEGRLSIGDIFEDYAFANYRCYTASGFPAEFQNHASELKSLVAKLSSTRCFWHHQSESSFWVASSDVYEVLFLADKSCVVTPTEIRLQSKSSRMITLETVFLDKEAGWPFVKEVDEGKELVVMPKGANYDYKIPQLTTEQCDVNHLEKILGNNPLALVTFRKAFGLDVVPDLQERANQYVHEVALKAFKAVRENYRSVKSNDKTIQQIEEKYNSPQRETGMFATRPVVIDPEPDPVLAAIMSYDARTDRDISLKRLAICINDLDRTGLANYDIPLEESTGPGQKAVSNLAEFCSYVRKILELGCKPREKAGV